MYNYVIVENSYVVKREVVFFVEEAFTFTLSNPYVVQRAEHEILRSSLSTTNIIQTLDHQYLRKLKINVCKYKYELLRVLQ